MQSDEPVTSRLDYGVWCIQKGGYGRVRVEYSYNTLVQESDIN
jgi:hypothetical protein